MDAVGLRQIDQHGTKLGRAIVRLGPTPVDVDHLMASFKQALDRAGPDPATPASDGNSHNRLHLRVPPTDTAPPPGQHYRPCASPRKLPFAEARGGSLTWASVGGKLVYEIARGVLKPGWLKGLRTHPSNLIRLSPSAWRSGDTCVGKRRPRPCWFVCFGRRFPSGGFSL